MGPRKQKNRKSGKVSKEKDKKSKRRHQTTESSYYSDDGADMQHIAKVAASFGLTLGLLILLVFRRRFLPGF